MLSEGRPGIDDTYSLKDGTPPHSKPSVLYPNLLDPILS
jgi:hypothetical protein